MKDNKDAMGLPPVDYPEDVQEAIIDLQMYIVTMDGYKELSSYILRKFGGPITRENIFKFKEHAVSVLGITDEEVVVTPLKELVQLLEFKET